MRHCIKKYIMVSLLILLSFQFNSCKKSVTEEVQLATVKGQVYSLNTPGPIPIGWVPPPYEYVTTIIVMNEKRVELKTTSTNEKGYFIFNIEAGTYFIKVKESRILNETGPIIVHEGETLEVKAYYDNGMR